MIKILNLMYLHHYQRKKERSVYPWWQQMAAQVPGYLPPSHVGDLNGVLDSWSRPGSDLAAAGV